MKIDRQHLDKLYGGWLGKIIGVIHGANIEGWSYEKIHEVFGEIESYPFTFKNFCADDDINGPLFYQRVFLNGQASHSVGVADMAHTLMNYVCDEHGFFWWGGYGISSEHTAYTNLKSGIAAPLSGSKALNGLTVSEQIGGQIFSDCWGLIFPDDVEQAADAAEKMASVTHDGEGIYGGRFVAACISKAFVAGSVDEILSAGLSVIPKDSLYSTMTKDVISHANENGEDWRKTFLYVKEKYGYQHFPGNCHIIPNAAVIVLSLAHSNGDFDRSINICNMCGWDTDCNVGNVGSIMGTYTSAGGIKRKWLKQVNDFICASSSVGSLNIQTVSQAAADSLKITKEYYQAAVDESIGFLLQRPSANHFHFEFPTATHALRTKGDFCTIANTDERAYTGARSLKVLLPDCTRGSQATLYHQSYYVPDDFNDNRYSPDFSPTVYPGDHVRAWFYLDPSFEGHVKVYPYWADRVSGETFGNVEEVTYLEAGSWQELSFSIPSGSNRIVSQVGYKIIASSELPDSARQSLTLFVDDFSIEPSANYSFDLSTNPTEYWNSLHVTPAQFTRYSGIAEMVDKGLRISGASRAEVYTGYHEWKDYVFNTSFVPRLGRDHRLLFRVQGSMNFYELTVDSTGTISLNKFKDGSHIELAQQSRPFKYGEQLDFIVSCVGGQIVVKLFDELIFDYKDSEPHRYGCVGFGNRNGADTVILSYGVETVSEGKQLS